MRNLFLVVLYVLSMTVSYSMYQNEQSENQAELELQLQDINSALSDRLELEELLKEIPSLNSLKKQKEILEKKLKSKDQPFEREQSSGKTDPY